MSLDKVESSKETLGPFVVHLASTNGSRNPKTVTAQHAGNPNLKSCNTPNTLHKDDPQQLSKASSGIVEDQRLRALRTYTHTHFPLWPAAPPSPWCSCHTGTLVPVYYRTLPYGTKGCVIRNKVDASRRAEKCRSSRVKVEVGVSGCA